ncbi:MAG: hypothetical protein R3B07_15825 [Polyangiaceae bacterium]
MVEEQQSFQVPPFQRVRVASLPEAYIQRLKDHAKAVGANRSAMNSDTLGCAAAMGIGSAIAVLVGVGKLGREGFGLGAVLSIAAGLAITLLGAGLVEAWRKSPLPEFESTTLAYHLVSHGTGELEAYCLALCSEVTFTNLYTNELYVSTRMRTTFGDRVLDLHEAIESGGRETPWLSSRAFKLRLDMIRAANSAARGGRWADVPGSELLPGRPLAGVKSDFDKLSVGVSDEATAATRS